MQIFSNIFDQLFSARALGIGLWVGLAVITVLLLVLMRTRGGHAKPLKKCVALSIFAHVLLMGYAYGTKLIFDYPPLDTDQPVHLTILAEDYEDESPADTGDVEKPKPWEQFTTQAPVQPNTINPGRQSVDHTQPINPHFEQDAPQFDALSPPVASKMTEPRRPVAKASAANVPRPEQAVERVASIERPNVKKPEAPPELKKPFGPNISELPRLPGTNSTSAETRMRRPSEADVAIEPKLPRLSEIPFLARSSDALKAVRDAALRDLLPNNSIQQENKIDPASEGNAQTQSGQTPRRLGDGQPLPNAYRLRFSGERLRIAKQSGGNEQTEAAV
ncbi:MAG: hypothetical protein IH991_12720, partial [Planctomycetes bacterium]|nr:hypothetical protein [Planctomycetota bacterium]